MDNMKIDENSRQILENLNKRIEDIKSFSNTAISVVGIVFVAFTIFAGFSLHQERASLDKLKIDTESEIKELIGLAKKEPKLICTTVEGEPLQGSTIKAKLKNSKIIYHYIMKNIGTGETSYLNSQIYSKEPLVIAMTKGSDEKSYDYMSGALEMLMEKTKFKLPAGYALMMDYNFNIVSKKDKAKGAHPVMAKIYYGKELPLKVNFTLLIE